MRKEVRDISVNIYTAKDGKEFSSEDECLKYEEFLNAEEQYETAKRYVETLVIDVADDNFPIIPLADFTREGGNMTRVKTGMRHSCATNNYRYYHLNSKDDLCMLAEVIAHDSYAKVSTEEVIKSAGKLKYPCTVICGFSYGWGREIGSFEKEMKLIEKYCKLHGYKVTLEEVER